MNEQLKKRLLSFAWRVSGMTIVGLIGILMEPEIIQALGTPTIVTVLLGLVAGEITKWLNSSK